MPVETLECQIVQAQLGRYLSGDAFSAEAVEQLESHIARCPICRAEAAQRRSALQSLLGTTSPAHDPEALVELLRRKAPTHAVVQTTETASKPSRMYWKPLAYGTALAVVLVAMSYMAKNPTSLFGDRVAETLPAAASTTQEPTTVTINAPASSAVEVPIEPLSESEWTDFGLDQDLPYDAETAALLEPWEWLAMPVDPVEEVPIEEGNPATLEDWELFGMAAMLVEPTPSVTIKTPAPPVVRRTPAIRKPKPANRVRVYAPGQ